MKTIYKYPIDPAFDAFNMPKGAKVLTVQTQDGKPFIWAIVDLDQKEVEVRKFVPYGTGHLLPDDPGRYVGTFQLNGGALVFHLFEQTP